MNHASELSDGATAGAGPSLSNKERGPGVQLHGERRRQPDHRQPPVQHLLPGRERPERPFGARLGGVLFSLRVRHERRERHERGDEREGEDVVVELSGQGLARRQLRAHARDERQLRDAAVDHLRRPPAEPHGVHRTFPLHHLGRLGGGASLLRGDGVGARGVRDDRR